MFPVENTLYPLCRRLNEPEFHHTLLSGQLFKLSEWLQSLLQARRLRVKVNCVAPSADRKTTTPQEVLGMFVSGKAEEVAELGK